MTITKHAVADRIARILHHEIALAELVDWAECALMDGEFAETDAAALSQVVGGWGWRCARFWTRVGGLRGASAQTRYLRRRVEVVAV